MNYLQNNAIQERFKKAASFQKSAVTLIRKPSAEEIGDEVKTFVRQEDGTLRVESTNIVSYDQT